MDKERYFLITDADSIDNLNNFLEILEDHEKKYKTDYNIEHKSGILVIVNYE